jgi:hypothetical protein
LEWIVGCAYGERIGILPLDGDLFGADAPDEIADSRLKNNVLLDKWKAFGIQGLFFLDFHGYFMYLPYIDGTY